MYSFLKKVRGITNFSTEDLKEKTEQAFGFFDNKSYSIFYFMN
jgi:hypothetical protein